jgi:hypothetical protein
MVQNNWYLILTVNQRNTQETLADPPANKSPESDYKFIINFSYLNAAKKSNTTGCLN